MAARKMGVRAVPRGVLEDRLRASEANCENLKNLLDGATKQVLLADAKTEAVREEVAQLEAEILRYRTEGVPVEQERDHYKALAESLTARVEIAERVEDTPLERLRRAIRAFGVSIRR